MESEKPWVVGTSFYLGIPSSTRYSAYGCVQLALDTGITRFFTTVQMPEADIVGELGEFKRIGALVRGRNGHIMADLSPRTFERLGGNVHDLGPVAELGITHVRMDHGFSEGDTMDLLETAESSGLQVTLNASGMHGEEVREFKARGMGLAGRLACHNYYPRMESGMSARYAEHQARFLHQEGMTVMGFVASEKNHRFITHEGLPTLERHRHMAAHQAAREAFVRGWFDQVYIGDQTDDVDELRALVEAAEHPHLVIRVAVRRDANPVAAAVAFGRIHQHLYDESEVAYRARGDRQRPGVPIIQPSAHARPRPMGTVALDTVLYPRYMGELHIAKRELPADIRTSVIGRVLEADLPLLEGLVPSGEFELIPVYPARDPE